MGGFNDKAVRAAFGRAVRRYGLPAAGDRVLVGLSGGVDSNTLLALLDERSRGRGTAIQLVAAHVDPGFPGSHADALVRPVKERIRFSRGHFAVGKIHYPPDEHGRPVTGWLIYVKLSVTGNEPDYLQDYRRRYPDFPHQSTADQVFEEDQFEAYRRLGEHITDDLFFEELLSPQARSQAAAGTLSIRDWYEEIVKCFFR